MAPSETPSARARIDLIDVWRGAGMLIVFLAHFLEAYYQPFSLPRPQAYKLFTRIATPAFMCISGVTLAVLFDRNRERFAATRDRLIDRGLFLLLLGHPLFMASYYFAAYGNLGDTVRRGFITDVVGLSVVLGALLVTRVGPRGRFVMGLGLLATAWVAIAAWNPPIPSLAWRLKDFLFGDTREPWLSYNFPPVPWFGLYLVASAAGAGFARAYREGRAAQLPGQAATLGIGLALAGGALHLGLRALAGGDVSGTGALVHAASLQKLPPSPTYMFVYVGLASLLMAGLMRMHDTRFGQAFARYVIPIGRNSLSAFLIQSYVYFVVVLLLPRPPQILLPVYFAVTVIMLRAAVVLWERKKWNRLLTVGYGRAARRQRATAEVTPVAQLPAAAPAAPVTPAAPPQPPGALRPLS